MLSNRWRYVLVSYRVVKLSPLWCSLMKINQSNLQQPFLQLCDDWQKGTKNAVVCQDTSLVLLWNWATLSLAAAWRIVLCLETMSIITSHRKILDYSHQFCSFDLILRQIFIHFLCNINVFSRNKTTIIVDNDKK